MNKPSKVIKPLLVIIVAAQLAFPVYMIATNEVLLAKGTTYKFRVAPRDPYDPFRGRYVTVRVVHDELTVAAPFETGDMAYATLDPYAEYASVNGLFSDKPERGDYLEVRVRDVTETASGFIVSIDYPFDRIFMNEKTAPLYFPSLY